MTVERLEIVSTEWESIEEWGYSSWVWWDSISIPDNLGVREVHEWDFLYIVSNQSHCPVLL
jgi:hypothetical protein